MTGADRVTQRDRRDPPTTGLDLSGQHDHADRLAAYRAEALGGPPLYSQTYETHADVVRMHSGNGPHGETNDRGIAWFDQAIADAALDLSRRLWNALHDYWAWATTTPMYELRRCADAVPDGIPLPRWSWDGLVTPR